MIMATMQADQDLEAGGPKGIDMWELRRGFPDGIPEIVRWARIIGLGLPKLHRDVLRELSYFAGMEGWAKPSQLILAVYAGYSRAAVCGALRDIEALQFIQSGLRHDEEGYHKEYRLKGFLTHWTAEFPESEDDLKKPVIERVIEQKDREIQQKDAKLQRLEKLLADAGIDTSLTADPGEGQPALQEEKKKEEEERLPSSSSSSSEGQPSVNQLDTRSEPFAVEVREKVTQHWESLRQSPDNPGGWRNPQHAVIRFYIKNADRFRVDIAAIEERQHRPGGGNGRIGPGMHEVDQAAKFIEMEEERQRRRSMPRTPIETEVWEKQWRDIEDMGLTIPRHMWELYRQDAAALGRTIPREVWERYEKLKEGSDDEDVGG